MAKNVSVFLTVLLGLTAAGCNFQTISIQNGELPPSLVPYVSPYLGSYSAQVDALFSKIQGQVQLALEGRRVVVTSTMDVVGPNCESSIGDLQQIFVETDSKGTPTIGSATFALNPGHCIEIEGRTVTFVKRGENRYSMQFLLRQVNTAPGGATVTEYMTWILTQ